MKKTTITEEELKLLSQEKELRTKPEDKISDEELGTLDKIDELKNTITERLEENGENPENLSLIIQKEKYRTRSKNRKAEILKLQEENETLKAGTPPPPPPPEGTKPPEWKEEADSIRAEARGYDQEEVAFAKVLQKGKELKTLSEVFESEDFKMYSESHRQEKDDNDTTPRPSRRSVRVNNKQVSSMSLDEKKKNYGDIVSKVVDKENRRQNL